MTLSPDAIAWERVRRLTFVPFLCDGRCALLPTGDGLALPSGEVLEGEDPMLDTGLRVPLVTAGFRRQGFHPFAAEGDHLYVWCEGDDGYRRALDDEAFFRDGSFLDVGCANGHLLESMVAWCAGRGLRLEPYGIDLSAGLVAPGGRLLASSYVPARDRSRHADRLLRDLGFRVDGVTRPVQGPGRGVPPSAWIRREPEPPG